jgi:hypothetical protein
MRYVEHRVSNVSTAVPPAQRAAGEPAAAGEPGGERAAAAAALAAAAAGALECGNAAVSAPGGPSVYTSCPYAHAAEARTAHAASTPQVEALSPAPGGPARATTSLTHCTTLRRCRSEAGGTAAANGVLPVAAPWSRLLALPVPAATELPDTSRRATARVPGPAAASSGRAGGEDADGASLNADGTAAPGARVAPPFFRSESNGTRATPPGTGTCVGEARVKVSGVRLRNDAARRAPRLLASDATALVISPPAGSGLEALPEAPLPGGVAAQVTRGTSDSAGAVREAPLGLTRRPDPAATPAGAGAAGDSAGSEHPTNLQLNHHRHHHHQLQLLVEQPEPPSIDPEASRAGYALAHDSTGGVQAGPAQGHGCAEPALGDHATRTVVRVRDAGPAVEVEDVARMAAMQQRQALLAAVGYRGPAAIGVYLTPAAVDTATGHHGAARATLKPVVQVGSAADTGAGMPRAAVLSSPDLRAQPHPNDVTASPYDNDDHVELPVDAVVVARAAPPMTMAAFASAGSEMTSGGDLALVRHRIVAGPKERVSTTAPSHWQARTADTSTGVRAGPAAASGSPAASPSAVTEPLCLPLAPGSITRDAASSQRAKSLEKLAAVQLERLASHASRVRRVMAGLLLFGGMAAAAAAATAGTDDRLPYLYAVYCVHLGKLGMLVAVLAAISPSAAQYKRARRRLARFARNQVQLADAAAAQATAAAAGAAAATIPLGFASPSGEGCARCSGAVVDAGAAPGWAACEPARHPRGACRWLRAVRACDIAVRHCRCSASARPARWARANLPCGRKWLRHGADGDWCRALGRRRSGRAVPRQPRGRLGPRRRRRPPTAGRRQPRAETHWQRAGAGCPSARGRVPRGSKRVYCGGAVLRICTHLPTRAGATAEPRPIFRSRLCWLLSSSGRRA